MVYGERDDDFGAGISDKSIKSTGASICGCQLLTIK